MLDQYIHKLLYPVTAEVSDLEDKQAFVRRKLNFLLNDKEGYVEKVRDDGLTNKVSSVCVLQRRSFSTANPSARPIASNRAS